MFYHEKLKEQNNFKEGQEHKENNRQKVKR